MIQQEFDFHKDINEPIYSDEEIIEINTIVQYYLTKKSIEKDDKLIIQLFFEKYCIEISKRLKDLGYFDEEWFLEDSSIWESYYIFIRNKLNFNSTTLTEFIVLSLNTLNTNVRAVDFQNNSISDFSFDRKITESILDKIQIDDIQNAINLYVLYFKIWNQYMIYNNPFNNNKGLLIHRIFSESIWPKKLISFKAFSEFEKHILKIIDNITEKNIYVPFFDNRDDDNYSNKYIFERDKLKQCVERAFDFEFTDITESYSNLIDGILINPSENEYKVKLILSKIDNNMMPTSVDIEKIDNLYLSGLNDHLAYKLLTKFYLFNLIKC